MMYSLMFLILTLVIALITLAVPIAIGVAVFVDANKRVDCSPWLWTLVALLVPYFAGLIVYLIVRKDFPLRPEYQKYDENGNPLPGQSVGLPTWAKVLLIILLIAFVVLLIGGCGLLAFGFAEAMGELPTYYYY